jgi:hypothetical protein
VIIQLEAPANGNLEAAHRSLAALAHSWGYQTAQAPAEMPTAAARHDDDTRAIDPVSLAAAVLSVPSAALAVLDLADRIHKRRRARELIDHSQQLLAQQVTVRLLSHGRAVELRALSPDQLLDLLADEDPAS